MIARGSALLSERRIYCPFCGESITLLIDVSAGSQEYVEDCEVCCQPINVNVEVDDDALLSVSTTR